MHGNQWVLKIAVLKYYSVSKRGTTAKSNPKQATDPISLHTKFGDNSSNTFPLNERKPCVTPDIGRRTPDAGHRTSDGEKSKNNISTPQGGGHNNINRNTLGFSNCCQGNHKISQSQVRIHQAWSVSEGDVCEWLLDYILVIFVVFCVYFT